MAFMWSSGVCGAVYRVICIVADTISLWSVENNGVTLWAFSKPLEQEVKVSLYEDVKWALIWCCAEMCKNSFNFCSHFNKNPPHLSSRSGKVYRWRGDRNGQGGKVEASMQWLPISATHTKEFTHNLDLSQPNTHFSVFPVNMYLCLINTHTQTDTYAYTHVGVICTYCHVS